MSSSSSSSAPKNTAVKGAFKDLHQENQVFQRRAWIAIVIVIMMMLGLVSRMLFLQIVQYDVHTTRSENNRIHVEAVAPTRGLIYDRNGILLADNRPSYSLTIVREQVKDLQNVLQRISHILKLDEEHQELIQERAAQRRRPFEPTLLLDQLTEAQIAQIAVNRHRLPGVEVEAQLSRHYPQKDYMAHVLGYVGRINEEELNQLDRTRYSGTHYIGKTGVEKFYEADLHGEVGYQKVETNARGRVLRVLEYQPPQPGKNLVLHLDSQLQQVAHEALQGRRGAIVAIEPATGGILAMVSTPSFDPNLFVGGIDSKTYRDLRRDPDLPLFNRSIRGQYPPASTVKPFMALAGLEYDVVKRDTSIYDPGYYRLPNDDRQYRNWKRSGHGKVDLRLSVVYSNDTYFYNLAYNLGIDNIFDFMSKFGFGEQTSVDVDHATSGLMPSREWKRNERRQPWFPGETLSIGIGQGYWLATPLQLASATAILANRGHWVQARLLHSADGQELPRYFQDTPKDVKLRDTSNWDYVFDVMKDVVHSPRGTARGISHGLQYLMAGKTGTAQVRSIRQGETYDETKIPERHRDHALFVAFAPLENPQIAIAVVVENGGGGSTTAAPIARKVVDAYLLPKLATQPTAVAQQEAAPASKVQALGRGA